MPHNATRMPTYTLGCLRWRLRDFPVRELKPLEAVELLFDPPLQFLARVTFRRLALADPGPFLQQQFLVLPVGLEIDGRDDVVPDQDRQREIAELAFGLRHIG